MRPHVLGLGAIAATMGVTAVLAWPGGGGDLPDVTEAEARAFLEQIVAAGQARDFDRLCSFNGAVANCEVQLRSAGRDAVPADRPRVTGSLLFEGDTPTRILTVEGTDGRGKPYRTEVGVFWAERGSLKAINAVYWSNSRVGTSDGPTSPDNAG